LAVIFIKKHGSYKPRSRRYDRDQIADLDLTTIGFDRDRRSGGSTAIHPIAIVIAINKNGGQAKNRDH